MLVLLIYSLSLSQTENGMKKPLITTEELLILQAIPGMLLALVLSFDHRKNRDMVGPVDASSKGHKYMWCALFGYAVGLVTALAAGILTQSAQPALLYLVSSWRPALDICTSHRNKNFSL